MLSSSRKKHLNKSKRFEINPKSVHNSRDEVFDKNSVSTCQKNASLLGTEKIEENWLTPDFSSCFLQQKKYIWIKAHGLKLTENLYTLVVMKDLMKILLPLLGTQKIEENWLTPNFSNAFQQQKRNIWIKAHGLKLTQTLYTLVVMKDFLKTFPVARKSASTVRNWKTRRKLVKA